MRSFAAASLIFVIASFQLANVQLANAQQKSIVETAVGAGNFNTLVAAVKAAGLVDALAGDQQLTVFAPTDEAFEKLDPVLLQSLLQPENRDQLKAILTYHVVPGRVKASDAYGLNAADSLQGQRLNLKLREELPLVNDASLVATDIECRNGIIHVVDEVLLPATKTIPEIAVEAGVFNTLVAAASAADLVDVLGGEGPFTVFAPADEAFAKLPAGTVESLLLPENKQKLADILKYHVVAGRVYDEQAVKSRSANTLLGRSVQVKFAAAGLMVNDATVTSKNVEASNGVIHIVDSVLLPPSAMSAGEALAILESAIDRGVPVYNSGHHAQCCDLYSNALNQVKDAGVDGMQNYVSTVASNAMHNASQTVNDADRAWALRRGIDSLRVRFGSAMVR
ncbi:fasciclin domain-containing protein [Mariniblastus fucicola]|uniref:Immunogenic protein MPT70 n=1 Tax=Mariniblastus fucicola TaxID=980251 RepID=A0A5B9PAD0_9BACT|nr:fasciclin domain-containing protein [Mariniblastus fucicola]QEG22185.1 Immunogenic protein MPT70 precursor [Mariniblastus fucicola]